MSVGQGIEVQFEGETYRVAAMGPGVRLNFSRWFKGDAFKQLDELRKVVDPARFNRLEADLTEAITLGRYEYGGPCHRLIMDEKKGVGGEGLARLRVFHPDITEEFVFRMADELGWDNFVARINAADGPALPKEQAPSTTGETTKASPLTTKI